MLSNLQRTLYEYLNLAVEVRPCLTQAKLSRHHRTFGHSCARLTCRCATSTPDRRESSLFRLADFQIWKRSMIHRAESVDGILELTYDTCFAGIQNAHDTYIILLSAAYGSLQRLGQSLVILRLLIQLPFSFYVSRPYFNL